MIDLAEFIITLNSQTSHSHINIRHNIEKKRNINEEMGLSCSIPTKYEGEITTGSSDAHQKKTNYLIFDKNNQKM